MENPGRLVENWVTLSKEMDALKTFRNDVASKKAHQMSSWLGNVEEKIQEFDALHLKYSELKNGHLSVRRTLNREVLDFRKSVNFLQEVGNAVSDSIEKLFSDLTGEKPRRFSHANLKSYTSGFSNPIADKVYKGQFPTGEQVVVKILTEIDAAEEIVIAEMNLLFKMFHRNLVKLYGFCFERNVIALVFEYMPNGSLDQILFYQPHGSIEWEKLYDIAIGTAKGISYLHDGGDEGIVHHCIRANLVLLDSNWSPKITNFGVAKLASRAVTVGTQTKVQRNPNYMAPEWIEWPQQMISSRITYKCDVFSFGMMLFEILGRRRNFLGRVFFPKLIWKMFEKREVEEIIKECGITEMNREKAVILCRVALWCIQYRPENRPSMNTVVKMLEKEIKVAMPPDPFDRSMTTLVKPFVDVVYDLI